MLGIANTKVSGITYPRDMCHPERVKTLLGTPYTASVRYIQLRVCTNTAYLEKSRRPFDEAEAWQANHLPGLI